MPASYNQVLIQVLFPTMVIFFFVSSIFAMVIGVGLILRSAAMFRFFKVMNRWISTRRVLKFAEIPRDADAALHGRLRLLGTAVVVGAAVSLYALLQVHELDVVRVALASYLSPKAAHFGAESAKWILLIGNAFAFLAGIAMLFFPSALGKVEAQANKWYSVRQHTRGVDNMHMAVDNWVLAYPRTAGLIIVGLGLFLALDLGVVLFGRS